MHKIHIETFSYKLEKLSNKKVYNLGVSSYGTVREIKRLLLSPYYKNSKTIIIQYHPNDLAENKDLDFNKLHNLDEYKEIFQSEDNTSSNARYIFRNYKTSIRLFFSDIIDIIFREKNLEIIELNKLLKGFKLVGDFLDKTILKPNNISYPLSRDQFYNSFK